MNGLPTPDQPPSRPELHASKQTLAAVSDAAYWRKLCPQLHVGEASFLAKLGQPMQLPQKLLRGLQEQVDRDGCAQVVASQLQWSCSMQDLAEAVVQLLQHGWPASFLVMYDEVWLMIQQASSLMKEATGNVCNMDVLAWYIDPNRADAGFSPHRDRQPDDSPATFRPDGSPMYSTCWIPFTQASPDNSCLYVIPRYADPGYYEGDPEEEGAPDPLARALHNKEAYQNIRALPAEPGSATIFTHRIIHWGSKGRKGCPVPRISMSFGCADDAYEPPYFSRKHLPCPPVDLRLALAAAQMFIYHERFPMTPKQVALYYEAFTSKAEEFDAGYKKKVMVEFVAASKESAAGATAARASEQKPTKEKQGVAAAAAGQGGGSHKKRKHEDAAGDEQQDAGQQQKKRKREKEKKHKQGKLDKLSKWDAADREEAVGGVTALAGIGGGSGQESEEDSEVLELAMQAMLNTELDFDDDYDGEMSEEGPLLAGGGGSQEADEEEEEATYDEHGFAEQTRKQKQKEKPQGQGPAAGKGKGRKRTNRKDKLVMDGSAGAPASEAMKPSMVAAAAAAPGFAQEGQKQPVAANGHDGAANGAAAGATEAGAKLSRKERRKMRDKK